MKPKLGKNLAVAVFFIGFLFLIMAGTFAKEAAGINDYKAQYSLNLNGNTSVLSKSKAVLLTARDALLDFDSKIAKRTAFINLYGLMQRVIGNRCVIDPAGEGRNVIKLDDGALTFTIGRENDYSEKAARITESLKTHLDEKGISLLYVQLPYKINARDKQLPLGVEDWSNEIADSLLKQLRSCGVDTFDLRDEIYKDKLDYPSIFFKTDHHWKPETGLWAAGKIGGLLNTRYGFDIDLSLLDINNFNATVYKNCFLGSEGKRVGKYYAGTDDFTLLLPKYKTDMTNNIQLVTGEKEELSGSFRDTMIFDKQLGKTDYFGKNTYMAYSGGNYPLSVNINRNLSGQKILLLCDSFSCTVSPFLSLAACRELHIIDPRYYTASVKDYIDRIKPDIVLILCNPSNIRDVFFTF